MTLTHQRLHRSSRLNRPVARRAAGVAVAAALLLTGCSGGTDTSPSTATSEATALATLSATPSPSLDPSIQAATNTLVPGFPTTLLPLMPGATVTGSTVERGAESSQALLVATVPVPAAEVMAFYTTAFTNQGFTAQPGDAVEDVLSKTFIRADGQEVLTVSIPQTPDMSTVSLSAQVLTASFN